MAYAEQLSGNSFEDLAEELVCRIFNWCSPVDELRAAASCKLLQTVYKMYRKHLTSYSVDFDASKDQSVKFCLQNTKKLLLNLRCNCSVGYGSETYRCLQSCIDKSEKDWTEHFNKAQELGLVQEISISLISQFNFGFSRHERHEADKASRFPTSAQPYVQQLLQRLPSLKTLWLGTPDAAQHLLTCTGLQPQSNLYRASFVLRGNENELQTLPALLPNLETLCFTLKMAVSAAYLQPLSRLCRLEFLSLHLPSDQRSLPDMRQIQSLRHLKLQLPTDEMRRNRGVYQNVSVDMGNISSLLQLQHLSLFNMSIANPQALTQLNATSLTLHSVQLCQQWQVRQGDAVLQYQAGPCWPKLKRVYLGGHCFRTATASNATAMPQS